MKVRNINKIISTMFISGAVLITACGVEKSDTASVTKYTSASKSDVYNGTGEVFKVATSGNTELTYNLDIGAVPKTVYYIFTNTNLSAETTSPSSLLNIFEQYSNDFSPDRPSFSESTREEESVNGLERGKPEVTEYNSNPWKYADSDKSAESRSYSYINNPVDEPLRSSFDEAFSFKNTASETIPARCKSVTTNGAGKTLNIWVANNCWSATGSGKAYYVTQAMVDAMAVKFLTAGAPNDVYDWVTNIYGAEWGPTSYGNLIAADNNIHILLYDIDADNSTSTGTLGFFWSKDNFTTASVSYSNEKIMFYMDAVMYATPEIIPASWSITDPMPAEIISTLAHEFQHMINFYQKNVLDGVNSTDTWINEMCSMVTEDLLADKLLVNGPRGVDYGTSGPGVSGNTLGRLPLFNYWNDAPLTTWLASPKTGRSYSMSYAFGAYLARNYGGAELFKDIVRGVPTKSVYGDYRDIVEAVKAHGGAADITMGDLLRDWGVAVVLSDKTTILSPGKYEYNHTPGYMTSTVNFTYNLGSINLFYYKYGSRTEPWAYSIAGLNDYDSATMNRGSNIYVKETLVTGMNTKKFRMRDGVKLTVVVK